MEKKPGILELYELEYSDLVLLSSGQSPPLSSSAEEIQRLELITGAIMKNLGPTGPGLLSVAGVSKASSLRRTLLPLARKLALLANEDRKRILKEHNLGSDVPLKNLDRVVSSFAMQMKYGHEINIGASGWEMAKELDDMEFKNLGYVFKELGQCMMEVGLHLARICDKVIGGHELEQSLLQSGSAKGRLIHYHSSLDNVMIREAAKGKEREGSKFNLKNEHNDNKFDLWQQWHYDYGIFTVLTSPVFMMSSGDNDEECVSPSGHTYLQIFDPNKKNVLNVNAPPESFIVQVGESADILSNRKLQSTLHCVSKPESLRNLSRETFVVFLQPAWSKTFSLSEYPLEQSGLSLQDSDSCSKEMNGENMKSSDLSKIIHNIVPPLSLRLKDGMTFAEFSRETTKQYYGGSGLQSRR